MWESKHAYRKWPERVWMRTWAVIHKTLSRSEVSAQLRNKNRARHRVGNALSWNAGSTKWRLHWGPRISAQFCGEKMVSRIRIRLQEYVVYSNVDETSRSWSLLLDQWGFVHDVYISYYFLFISKIRIHISYHISSHSTKHSLMWINLPFILISSKLKFIFN